MFQQAALQGSAFNTTSKSKAKGKTNGMTAQTLLTTPQAMPQLLLNMQNQMDQFQNKMFETLKKMQRKVDDIHREVKHNSI